jgi:hypothetical protein
MVSAAVGSLFGNLVYEYYFGETDERLPTVGYGVIDGQPVLSFSLKF